MYRLSRVQGGMHGLNRIIANNIEAASHRYIFEVIRFGSLLLLTRWLLRPPAIWVMSSPMTLLDSLYQSLEPTIAGCSSYSSCFCSWRRPWRRPPCGSPLPLPLPKKRLAAMLAARDSLCDISGSTHSPAVAQAGRRHESQQGRGAMLLWPSCSIKPNQGSTSASLQAPSLTPERTPLAGSYFAKRLWAWRAAGAGAMNSWCAGSYLGGCCLWLPGAGMCSSWPAGSNFLLALLWLASTTQLLLFAAQSFSSQATGSHQP